MAVIDRIELDAAFIFTHLFDVKFVTEIACWFELPVKEEPGQLQPFSRILGHVFPLGFCFQHRAEQHALAIGQGWCQLVTGTKTGRNGAGFSAQRTDHFSPKTVKGAV